MNVKYECLIFPISENSWSGTNNLDDDIDDDDDDDDIEISVS